MAGARKIYLTRSNRLCFLGIFSTVFLSSHPLRVFGLCHRQLCIECKGYEGFSWDCTFASLNHGLYETSYSAHNEFPHGITFQLLSFICRVESGGTMTASLIAFHNGEYCAKSDISIQLDDVGFILGTTVSERLRTFGQKVFRLDDHLTRLLQSLETIGLADKVNQNEIRAAVLEVANRNLREDTTLQDLGIAVLVTPGSRSSGPNVIVYADPLPLDQMATWYRDGVQLRTTSFRQVPATSWPAELKCRSRMHYYLADQQAASAQPGARALLLDQRGFVAEASSANLIAYNESEGIVSPHRENILPGISLMMIEQLADDLGIPFSYRDFTPDELRDMDEVMLCSTSPCVWSVVNVDGKVWDNAGPVVSELQRAWSQVVGIDFVAQAVRDS